jgi:transcriptional regulator with XRE-family HTH domain
LKQRYSQRHARLKAILKEERLKAGITQAQLCKRLKRHHNFVSYVEQGTTMLDAIEFIEYAEALELDARKLLGKVLG